jgi:PilZ domain
MVWRAFLDKRRSNRRRSLLSGRIIFNNRYSVIECTVRDISDTGARIAFAHPVQIPQEFELDIPKRGPAIRARVMWSNGNDHGISFVDRPELPAEARSSEKPQDLTDDGNPEQPVSSPIAPKVQQIVDEARQRIANLVGVPVAAVKLKVEIDGAK